jgi:hypothetical protein
MGLTPAELGELRSGSAVVKGLASSARQELAQLGVVGIGIGGEEFVRRFRDIEGFERGPGTPQIGKFGNPPRLADLASLTLPTQDLKALQACRPGDCDLKLSTENIRRIQREVNWTAADAARQANDAMRRVLLDLVVAYQTSGNEALGAYDHGAKSVRVGEEFKALLAAPAIVPAPIEPLLRYLQDFPRNRPQDVEEFFYWTVVEFGLKPTVRINHVVIYPLRDTPSTVTYAIATKQLYATHYFDTTLELRFLLDRAATGQRGLYLVSILRSRNDGMTGFSGSLLRPIISRRSRTGIRRYLEYVKRQMER